MRSRLIGIATIKAFDRDAKNLKKRHIDLKRMKPALRALVNGDDDLLRTKYRDHPLTGQWAGFRELHIDADWLLVYFIDGTDLVLVLTRTGTHDELYSSRTPGNVIRRYRDAERNAFG